MPVGLRKAYPRLRKSYGFHLVAQGPDPLPAVLDARGPYPMRLTVHRGEITFEIADLLSFRWQDDEPLSGGKIGFRQMAPMIGEYANLRVTPSAPAPQGAQPRPDQPERPFPSLTLRRFKVTVANTVIRSSQGRYPVQVRGQLRVPAAPPTSAR